MKKLGIIIVVVALGVLISSLVINQQRKLPAPDETRLEPARQASSANTVNYPIDTSLTQPEDKILDRYTDPSIAASAQELALTFYQAIRDVVAQLTEGQDVSSVTLQDIKDKLQASVSSDDRTSAYEQAQMLLETLAQRLNLDADTQRIWASEEFTDRAIEKALMLPSEEFVEWLLHSTPETFKPRFSGDYCFQVNRIGVTALCTKSLEFCGRS